MLIVTIIAKIIACQTILIVLSVLIAEIDFNLNEWINDCVKK